MNNSILYLQQFSLSGKVAIVTGGAGILGRHFCAGLADAGADIALVDIKKENSLEIAEQIRQTYKVKCKVYKCDLTEEIEVRQMVKKVVSDFGHIDILHNNAAGKSSNLELFFAKLEDYKLAEWRSIMSSNLDSMFLVAKYVGKHMVDNKIRGSIIQTASIYGVCAPDQRIYKGSKYLGRQINTPAVYSASKAGVIGLTKYLATYWAKQGIRVNSLTPGGIYSGQNREFVRRYSNRVPLNRMGTPRELVGGLIYLASEASSYVTGQNLVIDGGLSVW